jgi:hypothetical protein
MTDAYDKELSEWREEMDSNLRADYSWLALWGLFWLDEESNSIGSEVGSKVQLPPRAPKILGSIELIDDKVTLHAAADANIRLNKDETLSAARVLRADASGRPDFLFVDNIRFMLIQRGDQLAIRVWDPHHANRANFSGRKWFELDENFRVKARIEAYDPPKQVMVDDIIGTQHEGEMQAALVFEIGGEEQRLDAELLESGAYYIIMKDKTAGENSYPSGRYLVTEVAEGGHVVIDFNRAYNPPCAFTEHATCPLPRPENVLEVAILAGEQYSES